MKNLIEYKRHAGSIKFSQEDQVFFGTVQGTKDLITFEGRTPEELTEAFHKIVDELIDDKKGNFRASGKTSGRTNGKSSPARAQNPR